ncbi:hypothetical protein [Parafrankia sp. FMc2]|uniref:hypothetical protein n=1 Tax=Parafrankia sp. FMc2 TaxID=3233196 RepID=UPI0034D4ED44
MRSRGCPLPALRPTTRPDDDGAATAWAGSRPVPVAVESLLRREPVAGECRVVCAGRLAEVIGAQDV